QAEGRGPRPAQPDRRRRGGGPDPGRGPRVIRRLPRAAGPPRPDGGRAGPAVQQGAQDRRRRGGGPHGGLEAERTGRPPGPSRGRTWVSPSPNLRSLGAALLYPGSGLLETTNVSVGRGTERPFEWFGAPWIDGRRLAAALAEEGLPGVRFVPRSLTPAASVHKG